MEMTSGRIAPAFVKFSIPLLLGNLFQFFYSTTDILTVGNYCDTASLAAIGASANIIFTLTGFFNGLANGAGILVAHLYGAKVWKKNQKNNTDNFTAFTCIGNHTFFSRILYCPINA